MRYAVTMALMTMGILAGIFVPTAGHAVTPAPGTPAPGWIIGESTFGPLEAHGASPALIRTAFGTDRGYVFGSPASSIGVPMATFQSYQKIQAAFGNGTLPGHYQAVMYDNENWPMTPLTEQRHPDLYEHLAADLVHRHGMLFVAAPAPDIVRAIGVVIHNSTQATYLRRNLAGGAARYADVIDIQAQFLEPHLTEFVAFAKAAAAQARHANSHVLVYIGIATGPDGQVVTAAQLIAAYQAVRPVADGYWLNISGKNPFCPHCGTPKPQLAVALLHHIYGNG